VLVDSSVWIDHFRRHSAPLSELLELMQCWIHPFVIGELACGNLARRAEVMGLLQALPQVPIADHAELLEFVDAHGLYGRGLGWVDMHLLASARLANLPLWTLDRRLAAAAKQLSLQP
jgi:predicted nucleic acid-binding protein